jgi:GTPase SAR1 family protein
MNADNIIRQWYEEVSAVRSSDVPIFLVGCKCDLRSGYAGGFCFVSRDEAEVVASKIGARGYYECSAFSWEGLDRLVDATARAILEGVCEAEDEKKRCVVC